MCFGPSGDDYIFSGDWQSPGLLCCLLPAHCSCRDQEAQQPNPLLCESVWKTVLRSSSVLSLSFILASEEQSSRHVRWQLPGRENPGLCSLSFPHLNSIQFQRECGGHPGCFGCFLPVPLPPGPGEGVVPESEDKIQTAEAGGGRARV